MLRKRKSSVGCKHKATMQGNINYIRKKPLPRSQSPTKRSKHHCLGTTLPNHITMELNERGRNPTKSKKVCYRMAIYYYFMGVLYAFHFIHWRGKGGTISIIRKALHMSPSQRRLIKRILQEIMRCAIDGVELDRKIENINKTGRKIIILPSSVEEILIANWVETHCGFRMTTFMVNEHRRQWWS